MRALGAMTNYKFSPTLIKVTHERAEALLHVMVNIKDNRRLLPALAGQVYGKMNFANSQHYGKFGRAKLRPFSRRQHEKGRAGLNPQLESGVAPPKEIPLSLADMHTVVSYSDGEGADAGVGVALRSSRLPEMRPQAVFLEVPPVVRELWEVQRGSGFDILGIEAIGPIVPLHNWPDVLQHCLWCSVGSCQRGSSVLSGDIIITTTWAAVARQKVLP